MTVSLLIAVVTPSPMSGQADMPRVADIMSAFSQNAEALVPYPSVDYPDAAWVQQAVLYRDRLSPQQVESVLDGLEALAATAPGWMTRLQAVIWLGLAGEARYERGLTGVVGRLENVYGSALLNGDSGVQRRILLGMRQQAEQPEALSFLSSVVSGGARNNALMAVQGLLSMGPAGEAALRQLDSTGAISNRSARNAVRDLVTNGFPGNR